MTPEEARRAKQLGIERTSEEWIDKVQEEWKAALAKGRDYAIISSLNQQVTEVQKRVTGHFESLGYTFQEERYFGGADPLAHRVPEKPQKASAASIGITSFG